MHPQITMAVADSMTEKTKSKNNKQKAKNGQQ